MLHYCTLKSPPTQLEFRRETVLAAQLVKDWGRLIFRGQRIVEGEENFPLAATASLCKQALKCLRDDLGHLSRDRTLYLICSRFYWTFTAPEPSRDTRAIYPTSKPMELIAVNFLHLASAIPCRTSCQ